MNSFMTGFADELTKLAQQKYYPGTPLANLVGRGAPITEKRPFLPAASQRLGVQSRRAREDFEYGKKLRQGAVERQQSQAALVNRGRSFKPSPEPKASPTAIAMR